MTSDKTSEWHCMFRYVSWALVFYNGTACVTSHVKPVSNISARQPQVFWTFLRDTPVFLELFRDVETPYLARFLILFHVQSGTYQTSLRQWLTTNPLPLLVKGFRVFPLYHDYQGSRSITYIINLDLKTHYVRPWQSCYL